MTAPLRPADWILDLGEPVASLSVSPDGSHAAVIGTEGNAWIVNAAEGRVTRTFRAHEEGGFRAGWSPAGNVVATSGQDGQIGLWDPLTGERIQSFPAGAAWAEQLAWAPRGDELAVSAGKVLTLWKPSQGVVHTLKDHKSTIAALAWRADGSRLAAACYGGVAVYDPASGRKTDDLPWKTSLVSLAISPDSRWVVAGTQELSVQIWPLPFREGEELAMSGYSAKVRDLAWHQSGRYLATGGGEEIMVWDCSGAGPAGTTPRILQGHGGKVSALAYQRVGHVLASGAQDGTILFWNAGKSSQPLRMVRLAAAVTALQWAPDGKKVLVGCHDGRLAAAASPAL